MMLSSLLQFEFSAAAGEPILALCQHAVHPWPKLKNSEKRYSKGCFKRHNKPKTGVIKASPEPAIKNTKLD